jgi:hypothetical protein
MEVNNNSCFYNVIIILKNKNIVNFYDTNDNEYTCSIGYTEISYEKCLKKYPNLTKFLYENQNRIQFQITFCNRCGNYLFAETQLSDNIKCVCEQEQEQEEQEMITANDIVINILQYIMIFIN